MKKILIRAIVFYLIVFFSLAISADEPTTTVNDNEVEDIQQDIDTYVPIDDDGNFNTTGLKSKAELRIEKINSYVKPITKFLWGVEFTLSWVFVFSVLVWILLTELVVMPVSEVLDFNVWGSLFAAFIIATLAMQGFGKDMAAWMTSIATSWEAGATVLVIMIVIAAIYAFVMKYFGNWIEKQKDAGKQEQLDRDREVIHLDAEVSQQHLENVGDQGDAFSYSYGMRRGGKNGRSGRFVSKTSTEAYAKKFGDEAAKKRFGDGFAKKEGQ